MPSTRSSVPSREPAIPSAASAASAKGSHLRARSPLHVLGGLTRADARLLECLSEPVAGHVV